MRVQGDRRRAQPPGTFACELGLRTVVESNAPCDGFDPTLIQQTCTQRVQGSLSLTDHDANAFPGTTIAPPPDTGAWPASCRQLSQGNLGTARIAGNTMSFDGGLGDTGPPTRIVCQGPGTMAGP